MGAKIRFERPAVLDRLRSYFTRPPRPPVLLQVSSAMLGGLQIAEKDKKPRQRLIVPLPAGAVEPHFEKPNIREADALAGLLREPLGRLGSAGSDTAILLPEACFRVFVMSFESLPAADRERDSLILFRSRKQLPLPPDDLRLSYAVLGSGQGRKVVAALARAAVVGEYEAFFAGLGLRPGIVSPPGLSLVNLLDREAETAGLLVNLDDDSLSLVGLVRSEPALYRVKPLTGGRNEARRAEGLAQEIENTIHFIEDREQAAVPVIWFRSGLAEGGDGLKAELAARLPVPVRPVEAPLLEPLPESERRLLAPLEGLLR